MSSSALARQHDVLLCTGKTNDGLLSIKDNTMSYFALARQTMAYFASKTTRCPTLHQRQHDVLLCTGKTTRCPTLHWQDNTMAYLALARQTMSYFALARQHDVLLCIKDNTMSYFASKTTRCPTLHQRKYGVLFSTDRTTQYLALAEQNGKCLTLHSLESASYFAVARATCLVLVSVCLILRWLEQRVSFCTV